MVTPRIWATLKFFQGNTMMMNTYPKVKCSSSRCTSPGVMRPKSKWSMFGPSWPASLPLKIEERKRSETDCMNNALLQLYWMRGIFHSWEKKNCQTTAVLNIAAPIGIACVANVSNWVLHESWSGSQKKLEFFCSLPNFLDELARKRLQRRLL